MSYVKQICDGYSKKTMMGNWHQERIYPEQPFRAQQQKQARDKDQGITCFDNTGFQRALPRLSRRTKWETTTRIILDDGISQKATVMKEEYPNGEQQHANKAMTRPFDKTFVNANKTTTHPHSELKLNQKKYNLIDQKAVQQLQRQRNVLNYGSDFRSTLIQHPQNEKFTNYTSVYKQSYQQQQNNDERSRAISSINIGNKSAGGFNPVPEQNVKPITNMTGELKKQTGDTKEITEIQRSWLPPRDKAISYSMGRTANDFKKSNIPANDIQTSLNMNIGVQNIHPKKVGDGFFRHVRDITIANNNTFCSRP